jgi:uncharacterized protein
VKKPFPQRYGAWAVIAGASEGLGAAFAEALAARGVNLLLVARRLAPLDELAARLRAARGVEVKTVACDLADPGFMDVLTRESAGLELGVAIYNAAYAPVGAVLERPLDDLLRVIDVNVRGPLCFARGLAPQMVARGRGALVLMSSLAGFQGSPRLATYAATKAFNRVLGEGLWGELGPSGVDVVVSCAGAIRTPGFLKAARRDAPGTLDASDVAEQTLAALGGGPVVVPGAVNKLASMVVGRLLPRGSAVAVMRASTRGLT